MTRRLAIDVHFNSEERSSIYDYFKYTKGLIKTAKYCCFLLSRKGDSYTITRQAVKAWLEAKHPDLYSSVKEERLVELARRRANKVPDKPKSEYSTDDLVRAFRGED